MRPGIPPPVSKGSQKNTSTTPRGKGKGVPSHGKLMIGIIGENAAALHPVTGDGYREWKSP